MRNITGVSKAAAEGALRTFLQHYDCVPKTIYIPVDRYSGIFKPYAFVEFHNRAGLVKLLSLSEAERQLGGRTLEIQEERR